MIFGMDNDDQHLCVMFHPRFIQYDVHFSQVINVKISLDPNLGH